MRHATLRQLKVFETVARLSSFSRAAEELHLTQPAVSTQIAKLAEHAGLPLFEQLGKKIYLTPAGTELLHHCRVILAQFQEAEEAMTQFKGVAGGKLNVAVISAGDYFFPRLLVEFVRRHPGVALNLTVHNRDDLLAHLADNLTDLAVMVRPPTRAETVSEAFAPHPYVIVAAADHPLRDQPRISMPRLLRERFVVRETGSDTWQSMAEGFGRHMARLQVGLQIRSTETIKQAVIAGMGISFLSAHTVSRELRAGSLVMLDVMGFPLMLNWYVVQRRNKRLPPVAQAFKQFLLDDGAALIDGIVPVPLASAPTPTSAKAPPAPRARQGRPGARAGAPRR
jgi:LysR family transcriptional regulator, low CO2-responsive transcriptional regulator